MKYLVLLLALLSACVTTSRIRGLRTDAPPADCQYHYTRMMQDKAVGCWCSSIGTTDDDKPVILFMEVDEKICLKEAFSE